MLANAMRLGIGEPRRVEPPLALPVSAIDLRRQRNLPDDVWQQDVEYLEQLIAAATDHIERTCGLAMLTQTWELPVYAWPSAGQALPVPLRPVQAVTEVVIGSAEEAADFAIVGLGAQHAYTTVFPLISGTLWPAIPSGEAAVIRFVAGFGDAPHDVPEILRHAISLTAGTWYEYRDDVVAGTRHELPFSSRALLARWRMPVVA